MSKRLHTCSTYKVEYGGTEAFNYGNEYFVALMEQLSHYDLSFYINSEYDDDFELPVEVYEDFLSQLNKLTAPACVNSLNHCLADLICELGASRRYEICSFEELEECLNDVKRLCEKLYSQADTSDGFIRFAWF